MTSMCVYMYVYVYISALLKANVIRELSTKASQTDCFVHSLS